MKSREEGHVLRRMADALVGRQKTRWKDLCKRESMGLKVEDIMGDTKSERNSVPCTPF